MSTRALSRKLVAEHPLLFRKYTAARSLVCWYRGEKGLCKGRYVVSEHLRVAKTYAYNRVPPKSDAQPWAPVCVPDNAKCTLVLSDIHAPYHDERAVECAVKYARAEHDVDSVLFLGDIADCYMLSRFQKDPEARRFPEEIEAVRDMLDYVLGAFKLKWKAYKCGNHENRFETYLATRAPELFGSKEFELKILYGLHERGIQWVPNIIPLKIGYLWLLHGHELGRGITSPVNPARGVFLRANDIVLEGHYHRSSHHSDTMLRGQMISCWSIGCLCDLHPQYSPINKWNHGFAVVERRDGEGNFVVNNYKIINRKQVVTA